MKFELTIYPLATEVVLFEKWGLVFRIIYQLIFHTLLCCFLRRI